MLDSSFFPLRNGNLLEETLDVTALGKVNLNAKYKVTLFVLIRKIKTIWVWEYIKI